MNGAVVVTIAGNIQPIRASTTPDAASQCGEDDETVCHLDSEGQV
jgi:hypothetical protein